MQIGDPTLSTCISHELQSLIDATLTHTVEEFTDRNTYYRCNFLNTYCAVSAILRRAGIISIAVVVGTVYVIIKRERGYDFGVANLRTIFLLVTDDEVDDWHSAFFTQ